MFTEPVYELSPFAADRHTARSHELFRLMELPVITLGTWPTPIDHVTLRHTPDVLVKRDDLCGHGRGGAKARKIEHLVGHLISHRYDELITIAGNVTNLVFDLLPVLERWGIRARIFIRDDPPVSRHERDRIFAGVRDQVEFIGASNRQALAAVASAYAKSRMAGGRPFVTLPGLSHPAAVVANARGFLEMVSQRRMTGLPGSVFVSAATGTTLAGFLLAEHALRLAGWPPIRVIGVQVYPGAIRCWTSILLSWTERCLGFQRRMPRDRIEVVSSLLHGGFGRYTKELATLCERIESETGIALDPIFGGKTWSAMEAHLTNTRERRATLYWHCGHTPEWRALGAAVRTGGERS